MSVKAKDIPGFVLPERESYGAYSMGQPQSYNEALKKQGQVSITLNEKKLLEVIKNPTSFTFSIEECTAINEAGFTLTEYSLMKSIKAAEAEIIEVVK